MTEIEAMFWRMEAERHGNKVPKPGEPQCEADGVRNGPDGPGGTEHHWTCTAPGTVDVDGTLMCEDHAGECGYGPKQEEYGFDPDDGLNPTPVPSAPSNTGEKD